MTFAIGDRVKMVNCYEAKANPDKIWIVRSDPWALGCGDQVVLLEGKTGGFSCDCLVPVSIEDQLIRAKEIYDGYYKAYNGSMQGLCLEITSRIISELRDAVPVRGYLCAATGWRRSHWWSEIGGVTFDPFGDSYAKTEPGFYREIVGRNDLVLLDEIRNGVYA